VTNLGTRLARVAVMVCSPYFSMQPQPFINGALPHPASIS